MADNKDIFSNSTNKYYFDRILTSLDISSYDRTTVDFALIGIKSTLILNGGALTILPVYWTLMEVDFGMLSLISFSCFLLALVSSLLSNVFAYFAEGNKSHYSQIDRNYLIEDYYIEMNREAMNKGTLLEKQLEGQEDKKKEMNSLVNKANSCRKKGIFFIFLSIILFIIGSSSAAYIAYDNIQKQTRAVTIL